MRIAILSPDIGDAYGQERVIRSSTELLRAAGHSVYYVAERQVGELPPADGTKIVPGFFSMNSVASAATARRLQAELHKNLEEIRPDVVHLIDQLDYRFLRFLCETYPVVLTAHTVAPTCPSSTRWIYRDSLEKSSSCLERSGWKCLVNHHRYGCLAHLKSDLHRWHAVLEYQRKRKALSGAKVIAAISRYVEARLLMDGWPREQVRLIYNPVRPLTVPHPLESPPKNLLSTAARLVPLKGIAATLLALGRLKDLEWEYWICGEGPARQGLEALSNGLGLAKRVKFLGSVPYDRTQAIFQASRFVIQSNSGPEGFGLSVAEALALGTPVVGFDVPALNEIVIPEETGLLARSGDVGHLSDCIRRLIEEDSLCQRLRSNGPESIQNRYAPEIHLRQTLEAYQFSLTDNQKIAA